MKSRVYYEVDPHNRLIIKRSGRRSNVKKFRKVVYGRFKTDNKNTLYYEAFKPSGTDIPQKIKFSGTYSLDKKNNLILTLDRWNNQTEGNRLRLKTELVDANANKVVFLYTSKTSEDKKSISIIKLYGSWHADENNRLTFAVEKENRRPDSLTLFNAWKINKNNEIECRCGKDGRIITLKGNWDIKDRHTISYTLDKGIGSGFDLRTSLGRVFAKKKKTYVKFYVIIEISKKKRIKRDLVFGCKYSRKSGREIVLEFSPRKRNAGLKLTKEILNQKGLAYIESFLKDRERYIGGGLAFRW